MGPNYKRPDVPAPPQFRAGEAQPSQTSLGDVKWFDLFQDEMLRELIKEALQANYDIRIAAQRVLEAEGQLAATRSATLSAVGRAGERQPYRRELAAPVDQVGVFGVASWEIDLFGKLRRATEAARADLLAIDGKPESGDADSGCASRLCLLRPARVRCRARVCARVDHDPPANP